MERGSTSPKIRQYYIASEYALEYLQNVAMQGMARVANMPWHHSVIRLKTSFLNNFYAETLGTPGAFRQSLNGVNKLLIACSKAVIDLSCM